MKAIQINSYGSTSLLEYQDQVPRSKPGPDDILVRLKASSVNPSDTLKRQGYGHPLFEKKREKKFPWVLGSDRAGVVTSVCNPISPGY